MQCCARHTGGVAINFDGPDYLYEQLADDIRDKCRTGVYPSGHRIPSITQLMAEHGLSDRTVRQAIAKLVSEGVLVTRPGKGTYCR